MRTFPKTSSSLSHDELFIERYERLLSWSIKLTDNNRELAEDLVQDAFVQFTFSRPDLSAIQNVDSYLYGMLRHLHLSQVRRATRARLQPLSIVEYESAEMGLRAMDPRTQIQVQDELRHVCHYACLRKQTAKVASVLILRFFHGYYPSEIVRILRSSRQAVRERLRIARAEARLTLENPNALSFLRESQAIHTLPTTFARTATDFLIELRNTIFSSRCGECILIDKLQELYCSPEVETVGCSILAHIVSCRDCLDNTNRVLDLPLLSQRYPTDSLDRESTHQGGDGPSAGGSASGSPLGLKRKARETFEHDPQELCVSVNGYLQGSQKIGSELSELTLSVKDEAKISFIEIFSEQDVRLLFMSVDEHPPEGPSVKHLSVRLSDARTLELTLRFRSPWPTLHVVYRDPSFGDLGTISSTVAAAALSAFSDSGVSPEDQPVLASNDLPTASANPASSSTRSYLSATVTYLGIFALAGRFLKVWRLFANRNVWLNPGIVTAVIALLLISVVLFLRLHHSPTITASAAELLQKSIAADDATAAATDTVLHRTITLEETRSVPGAVATGSVQQRITRYKIEIWQSAEKVVTARRLYDERGALVAGDWRRADGVQTLYHHGARPQLQLTPEKRSAIALDDVWQLDPTAKQFASLIRNSEGAQVHETSNTYVISYAGDGNVGASQVLPGLVNARLVLGRGDLHVTEMTLLVRSNNINGQSADHSQLREYKFLEASFERRAHTTVAPAVFEPEAELLGEMGTERPRDGATTTMSPPVPTSLFASPELELEVLSRLNQAGAFYGEQISLTRTPAGELRVQGIVETDKRKSELLLALAYVKGNPAVQIQIETVAEAQAHQSRQARDQGLTESSISLESIEVETKRAIAAELELRAFLSRQRGLSGDTLEQEVRRFTDRAMARTRNARRHALALKQIAERFSSDDLGALDEKARVQWRGMMAQHARQIGEELEILRQELQPVFPTISRAQVEADVEIAGDADFARAAKRLFELATSLDEAVGRSFSIYEASTLPAPITTNQFSRSLLSATVLAQKISKH